MTKTERTRLLTWRSKILQQAAEAPRKVARTCRYFGISRKTYYKWQRRYDEHREAGLCDRPRTRHRSPRSTPREVVGKILYLRETYHFSPRRIADYLKRFHDVSLAMSSVHRILRRHGMHRLPANLKHRPHGVRWKRHEKPQPGHRLQLDVKFLERIPGTQKRLYQFTAIDDCTRLRVLKVYDACNQPTAIQFIDEVVRRRPFRVHVIQTDNGPEFCSRALLTWAYNRGVALRLIEPGKPNQNAYIELFNGRFRDECLDEHWFTSLAHAQVVIETWRREYNEERPKKSLGGNFACAMANHLDPRKALSARDFAPYGHRRRVMISSNIRCSDSGRD